MIIDTFTYLGTGIFMLYVCFLIWLMLCIISGWWKGLSRHVDSLSKDVQKLRRDMGEQDD